MGNMIEGEGELRGEVRNAGRPKKPVPNTSMESDCIDLAQKKGPNPVPERVDAEELNITLVEEENEEKLSGMKEGNEHPTQKASFNKVIEADKRQGKPLAGWVAVFLGSVVVSVLVQHVPGAEAIGWPIKETEQTLPQETLRWLKVNGCPERGSPFSHWHERNRECCGSLTGVFHCQEVGEETDGEKYLIAACRPEQVAPPGKKVRLLRNETGYPELDLTEDCSPGTFRKESLNSSFSRYQRCELKTKGDDTTEDKRCDGGTTNDDLFVCKEGYQSHCPHGHNHPGHPCYCFPLHCENGTQPFRNITGRCSDRSIRVTYGCQTPPSLKTPVTDSTTVASPPGSGQGGIDIWVVIIIIIVLVVLAVIIGIVVFVCVRRRRSREFGRVPS